MKIMVVALLTALLIAGLLPLGFTSPPTAPAFLWSPHLDGFSSQMIEAVNYRTLFPRDLAKSVMSEGGWSSLLCSGKETPQSLDFALLFIGKELQSRDISRPRKADPMLVDFPQGRSLLGTPTFLWPFPMLQHQKKMRLTESSLISQFVDTCGNGLGSGSIAVLDSCSLEGENFEKLADISADYLALKMLKRSTGQANLIVVCHGGSQSQLVQHRPVSEAEDFSQLISSVEQLDAKYTVLYVSDPSGSNQHRSYRDLQRFLAEFGNGSANSTICDGVCQIKSSLLEGIFVGIVLLIILISGLCCMAGIDTPTRFETPKILNQLFFCKINFYRIVI